MGGRTVEEEGSGRKKKIEFLPENGGFWCILGLLFTFMQKLVRPMGAAAPPRPLDPPLLYRVPVECTGWLQPVARTDGIVKPMINR